MKVDGKTLDKEKFKDKGEYTRSRSPRNIRNKSSQYSQNITKRGTLEPKV